MFNFKGARINLYCTAYIRAPFIILNIMKHNFLLGLLCIVGLSACEYNNEEDNKKEREPDPKPVEQSIKLDNYKINSLYIDSKNVRWVGTDSGLYISKDTVYSKVNIGISGAVLSLAYESQSNVLWVGTKNGLSKLTLLTDSVVPAIIENGKLSNAQVSCIHIDLKINRWFGTYFGFTLNKAESWKKDNFELSVIGELVPSALEDAEINSISSWDGDYYIATSGRGVYRTYNFDETLDAFSGATQLATPYNGENLTDSMFVTFVDSKNRIWLGGAEGLQNHFGHDTKNMENFKFYLDQLPSKKVRSIAEAPDGKIWVGTENGLAVLQDTTWSVPSANLPNPFVTAIAFDTNGSAWIGTKKGLKNIK